MDDGVPTNAAKGDANQLVTVGHLVAGVLNP